MYMYIYIYVCTYAYTFIYTRQPATRFRHISFRTLIWTCWNLTVPYFDSGEIIQFHFPQTQQKRSGDAQESTKKTSSKSFGKVHWHILRGGAFWRLECCCVDLS